MRPGDHFTPHAAPHGSISCGYNAGKSNTNHTFADIYISDANALICMLIYRDNDWVLTRIPTFSGELIDILWLIGLYLTQFRQKKPKISLLTNESGKTKSSAYLGGSTFGSRFRCFLSNPPGNAPDRVHRIFQIQYRYYSNLFLYYGCDAGLRWRQEAVYVLSENR